VRLVPITVAARGIMNTDELSEHLFGSLLGALDMITIHIGDQLGLYDLLHRRGPLTADETAEHSGMNARYAREWLEQQCVAGLIDVDDASATAAARRYSLSDDHAAVLADPDSLAYLTPFARMTAAAAGQLPALLDAYRTGGGVGWEQYGEQMRTAQADANRPAFLRLLGTEWLPAMPDVDALLTAGGRVADIGCGDGWSSLGMALAYPRVTVDGFDVDANSVAVAHKHAAAHGVGDRVTFHHVDVADAPGEAAYDLVTAFECIHDMPDPISVLAGARRMVRDDGAVIVMDERVPETFTGPGDAVEQLMYGVSMLICLPDGLSHEPSVGTGTVMRPATLRDYAVEAGFSGMETVPIEHDFFRFYRLLL
jgi:SAM-dependent methyltransferase